MSHETDAIFPENATCGYMEKSGSWTIDVGVPEDQSMASLNNFARTMILSFFKAFGAFCRVTQVIYDTLFYDRYGEVKEAREGEIKELSNSNQDHIWQELTKEVVDNNFYFTRIVLTCDMQVFLPNVEGSSARVWIPGAVSFYFGYVLEYNEGGKLVPVDCGVIFKTSIDVWVARTLNPATLQWRDNSEIAKENQPLLAKALEEWERAVGKPIVDWDSRYYGGQIYKYGFKLLPVS